MPRKSYSEQEREEIRKALMNTVIQCIVEKGLVHSSIELVCKKVGISKSFFYQFFSSKEELVLQALRYQQPKLLNYAQTLMDDPKLSWREGAGAFLKSCCYGAKNGIAVLSLEEEQEVYRCLTPVNFEAFRQDQIVFFRNLLKTLQVPVENTDPRLFGNIALSMMMVYQAIPDKMPFLFPELADQMVDFYVNALLDKLEEIKSGNVQIIPK